MSMTKSFVCTSLWPLFSIKETQRNGQREKRRQETTPTINNNHVEDSKIAVTCYLLLHQYSTTLQLLLPLYNSSVQ
jgi:hypothetical protein